ncbi:flagellar hook protein FlgE [Nordella sp. HKS 07]|uniref:flagellar hook protein FlgE n=1 Tax=Nordella sp. HKS 07 TaxID=2712222 RepID=UPI0013E168A0|nr:flagellar hook protein FlgE [Nordella sp. HKS 07]QIG49901.1 flagellar hook protein FlgE [Nordella sp. HKS 07]
MSLYGVMRTSTSGMTAQANRLSAVADNIANSNTTGYKRSFTEFSSLIIDANASSYTPGSVSTVVRTAISQQGNLLGTTSTTDLAVRGNGFFVVSDSDGTPYLTRAGSFVPDSEGNLVNAAGFNLMGYPIINGQVNVVANGYSGLEIVNVDDFAMRSNPTTQGEFRVKLPDGATAVAPPNLPSANQASATYTAKTSLVTYDNLGNEVILDVYLTKTGNGTWQMAVFDKSAAGPNGFPYTSGPLTTANLTFNTTTGQLTAPNPPSLSIPVPNGQTMTLDIGGTSQLAGDYTVVDAIVNGNAPVSIEKVNFGSDGVVYATYENGNKVPVFKIPLANVTSPDNLNQLTGNVFSTSPDSGDVQIGFPGADGRGSILSNTLEQSTVDMATELTTMIDAQRGYTANSKVFQTGAELMDVLVNLKR